jgi:hypothetical protein
LLATELPAGYRYTTRQLATEWEDALLAQRQLQEDYARFVQAQSPLLSQAEREAIEQLAQNIPALWHAPTTTMAERKEIVRQIIQRIIVAGEGRSERLQITIEWVGGGRTAGLTTRPISHIAHLSDYPRLCERIRTLAHEGHTITQMTALLAHQGFRSPKHARPFSRQSVIELMRRLGVHQPRRHRRPLLQEHEWWLADLERELGKSNSTLHQWRKRGWLHTRWHDHSKRWVAWADAAELQRLKQRSALPAGEVSRQMWLDAQRSHPTGVPPVTAVA